MASLAAWAGKVLDSVDESASDIVEKSIARRSVASPASAKYAASGENSSIQPPDDPMEEQERFSSAAEEIASLKSVWAETRSDLAKTRAALRQREEQYRESIGTTKDELEQERRSRQQEQEQNQAAVALLTNSMQNKVDSLTDKVNKLLQIEESLAAERDALVDAMKLQSEEHARRMQETISDFEIREQRLQEEREVHSGSLQEFRDRETDLTQASVQYANALAHAQRELQERTGQVKLLKEECEWLSASKVQAQLDIEQAQKQVELGKEAMQQLTLEHKTNLSRAQEKISAIQEKSSERERELTSKVSFLESQLVQNGSRTTESATVQKLESKVAAMTQHLLQRQAELEKTGSVASSLSLHLDTQTARLTTVEAEKRRLEQRLSEIVSKSDIDLETGGVRRRRHAYNRNQIVGKVVDTFDLIGSRLGLALRRHPSIRIAFILYILFVHLWVLFILQHYLSHSSASADAVLTPRDRAFGAALGAPDG